MSEVVKILITAFVSLWVHQTITANAYILGMSVFSETAAMTISSFKSVVICNMLCAFIHMGPYR